MQKFVWGLAVTTAALLLAAPIHAQEPVTVLLLDRNAIQANVAPNHFPAVDVNAAIADVGVRDALPFFNLREGQRLVLPGGSAGHEGWLAFTAVPSSWSTTEGNDGLENFVYAGPGLGSPDSTGSRTTLLGTKTEVVPLRAEGLRMLTGRTVCAVAFANELPRSASGVTVSGPNLGIVAFRVQGLLGDDAAALPSVELTVLETRQVCAGDLAPMIDAPVNGQ
jgi:hypothetical protein